MNVNSIISDADAVPLNAHSALDLLASAYGDPSDSNEDVMNQKIQVPNASNELINHAIESQPITSSNGDCDGTKVSSSSKECQQGPLSQGSKCIGNSNTLNGPKGVHTRNKDLLKMVLSEGFQPKYIYSETHKKVQCEPSSSNKTSMETPCSTNYHVSHNSATICMNSKRGSTTMVNNLATSVVKPDKDSSRMHVFCLEHAIEVEKQLQAIGGADIFLLCHPGQSLGLFNCYSFLMQHNMFLFINHYEHLLHDLQECMNSSLTKLLYFEYINAWAIGHIVLH
jgi:hypothetical protein